MSENVGKKQGYKVVRNSNLDDACGNVNKGLEQRDLIV